MNINFDHVLCTLIEWKALSIDSLLQIKLRTILVVSPEGGHKHLDNKISI